MTKQYIITGKQRKKLIAVLKDGQSMVESEWNMHPVATDLDTAWRKLEKLEPCSVTPIVTMEVESDGSEIEYHIHPATMDWYAGKGEIPLYAHPQPKTNHEFLLGELLAVIHRDGGHYEGKYGTEKATKDAIEIFCAYLQNQPADGEIKKLCEQTNESGG